jgi:prepilin-type processing-associated H-X9-DG protein
MASPESKVKSRSWQTWVTTAVLIGAAFLWYVWPSLMARPPCVCVGNLKQIGLATAMYAELYEGQCPVDSANPTLVGSMQLLSNFLTSASVLYCPTDHRPGARPESDFRKLTVLNISYSYVPNQLFTNVDSNVIIALDRIYSTSEGSFWPSQGNHDGKVCNVLFNDCHIQGYRSLPSSLKDKDGKEVVLSP